jgi:thiol-disulfide isomerase/thioredoxin
MKTRSFCKSVLVPLAAILTTILIAGCEPPTPVAPWPTLDQHRQAQPDNPHQCCRPKIIAFGADWCPLCVAGHAKLDAMEQMGVDVERVNIDTCSETTKRYYGITSVPVYFVIRCGHETVRTQDIDEAVRLMNEVFGRS